MKILVYFFVFLAVAAQAETLYKVVGPDGKTTYTDRPPTDAKSKTTTLQFADAPSTPLPDSVLKYQAALQKSMQSRLAQARNVNAIGATTLYSASWCGYCKKAKAYLRANGIRYSEFDIDTADGGVAYFEAGGRRGVPLLLADGKRIEGFSDGSYDNFFSVKK